jgi:succinate-acetate transporter protein
MNKPAHSAALGYAAFALTLWMNSMIPAGWFDASDAMLANLLAIVLGGCVMALAGLLQALRGRALDATLFLGFAAYWWVAALAGHLTAGGNAPYSQDFLGWYQSVWAFLAFCIWLAACRDGVARTLFASGLCLLLLAFALADWTRLGALTVLGGYFGLVTAVVGIYAAAAELINATSGHVVLPLGESSPDAESRP